MKGEIEHEKTHKHKPSMVKASFHLPTTASAAPCAHEWGNEKITVYPTGATAGKMILTCSKCNETKEAGIPATGENPFKDVYATSYCYDSVTWATTNNITNGVSSDEFAPNDKCTRAQIVTFLWRANGKSAASDTVKFDDVPTTFWAYEAISWAAENGITKGTSDMKFEPDDYCTRAQIVTFIHRSVGSPIPTGDCSKFSDVANNSWCASSVAWAVENGITQGTTDSTFSPDDTCTRGQAVTFLYRLKNKQTSHC